MPITEACSGLLFYFHHRWLCDRGTAVVQLLYRCRISLRRLEIFRKTISLPGYGIKYERESPTAVCERLTETAFGWGITGIGRQRPGLFLDRVYNRLTDGRLTIPNALGLAKKNRFILIDGGARKIPCRPISCRGSYRRYPVASSRLPGD